MNTSRLSALGTCSDAVAWVAAQPDWKTAWTECQHGDWMMWFLVNRDVRAAGEPVDTDARLRRIALRAADRAVREHAPEELDRAADRAAEPHAAPLRAHAARLRALAPIDTVERARAGRAAARAAVAAAAAAVGDAARDASADAAAGAAGAADAAASAAAVAVAVAVAAVGDAARDAAHAADAAAGAAAARAAEHARCANDVRRAFPAPPAWCTG